MPIVLFRVDERLIHGQVVVGWGGPLDADRIVVVDDDIADSPWEQELYCLGVPPEIEASFVGVPEARRLLASWRGDPRRMVVLVRDVPTVAKLAEDGLLRGEDVNLGGIHHAVGRDRVLPYLFLSPADRVQLRDLAAGGGVRLSARDLPGSRRVPLDELLAEG
ncbi:MAG TPA: PTS sugar transporter subunit IIB [Longimicrobiaceae bacterium]|jgi:PTS system mannose-specific IIB component/fructoselysine and glucoselysine-specific PTS system IIB component|nr:PTS sugar transporter subunit IIB [Longimicrobiaceae bacterium]